MTHPHERLLPALTAALNACGPGDKLIVWKLDRLARSVGELIRITQLLEARAVHFECIQDKIDTSTAAGRFMFHVMAATSEFERSMIAERTSHRFGHGCARPAIQQHNSAAGGLRMTNAIACALAAGAGAVGFSLIAEVAL